MRKRLALLVLGLPFLFSGMAFASPNDHDVGMVMALTTTSSFEPGFTGAIAKDASGTYTFTISLAPPAESGPMGASQVEASLTTLLEARTPAELRELQAIITAKDNVTTFIIDDSSFLNRSASSWRHVPGTFDPDHISMDMLRSAPPPDWSMAFSQPIRTGADVPPAIENATAERTYTIIEHTTLMPVASRQEVTGLLAGLR